MASSVIVSFCCNDRNGGCSGKFTAIEFEAYDHAVGCDLRLSLDAIDDSGVQIEFMDAIDVVAVAGERHHVINYSRKRYVGSIAWDQVSMERDDALGLLKRLLEMKLVDVTECDDGHPFELLVLELKGGSHG